MFPHAPTGREHYSAAPESNTGDGLRLGEAAGGVVRQDLPHAGAWAPVSLVPRADGSGRPFPAFDRACQARPRHGARDGRRFANEADSYHDLMQALFRATPTAHPSKPG